MRKAVMTTALVALFTLAAAGGAVALTKDLYHGAM